MSKRFKIQFSGIVQGVGFRPFIYKYATELGLTGFVRNNTAGVDLEIQGDSAESFLAVALPNLPPLAVIDAYTIDEIDPVDSDSFEIIQSNRSDTISMMMSPDIAVCANCREEFFSKSDRRFDYPFINCTDCGPRFTIIRDLPYDRPKTTMERFPMCSACRKEYENPLDRRYHAQPVSCYNCGPQLTFDGETYKDPAKAVRAAIEKLKAGMVVALKGLGGYHLACLATSDKAVGRLREKKKRRKKPFALMARLDTIKELTEMSSMELQLLTGITAPIVLLKRKPEFGSNISDQVAPGQDRLGFMLPYTPLHLYLFNEIDMPLVMTSANFSDEPIVYQDTDPYLARLSDHVLGHDREINIFCDDSVMEVFREQPYMIRRSRGYAPSPHILPIGSDQNILAVGAMLKTTFTMINENKAYMSQYIGNTDSPYTLEAEEKVIRHFQKLFRFEPDILVTDSHPDFPNRSLLKIFPGIEHREVQHHKAHVASLLAEKGDISPLIGIAMDGTGYGDDGNIWGGEFFYGDLNGMERYGHLKYLNLPGGEKAIHEPWRFTLSILYSTYGDSTIVRNYADRYGPKGQYLLESIRKMGPSVLTSSCGRLFDGISTLLDLGDINYYDGHLPVLMQTAALRAIRQQSNYSYQIDRSGSDSNGDMAVLNLLPMIDGIRTDRQGTEIKAYRFHLTLAEAFVEMAEIGRERYNCSRVGLTGGVFQNTLLLDLTKTGLERSGFDVLIHSIFPPNDSGISLGQGVLALGG